MVSLRLEGWLYIISIVHTLFAPGGTILLGKFGRRWVEFFHLCPNLRWKLAGVSFYGSYFTCRSSRSSYFIGVA